MTSLVKCCPETGALAAVAVIRYKCASRRASARPSAGRVFPSSHLSLSQFALAPSEVLSGRLRGAEVERPRVFCSVLLVDSHHRLWLMLIFMSPKL